MIVYLYLFVSYFTEQIQYHKIRILAQPDHAKYRNNVLKGWLLFLSKLSLFFKNELFFFFGLMPSSCFKTVS